MPRPLSQAFFERDPRQVACDLLGKVIESSVAGARVSGRIVECEAYLGSDDAGSHAATRGVTERNRVMYGPPASVYVYFTYGMHHMLNLVCEPEGTAGAVLIRAIEPIDGAEVMRVRRGGRSGVELANGPGKVAQALGVNLECNGNLLGEGSLVVYDAPVPSEPVAVSGRIGLGAGHEHDFRWYLVGNPSVSKARPGARSPRSRADCRSEEGSEK